MCAGDVVGICHVENVDDGSHDMAQLSSGLAQCRCDRCNGALQLHISIAVEMGKAGRRSRDEYLIPDADANPRQSTTEYPTGAYFFAVPAGSTTMQRPTL